MALAERRLNNLINFCEQTLESDLVEPLAKVKCAELYRNVIRDSAKLGISSRTIIRNYREIEKLKSNHDLIEKNGIIIQLPSNINSKINQIAETKTFVDTDSLGMI
jgi:hypothetical protein